MGHSSVPKRATVSEYRAATGMDDTTTQDLLDLFRSHAKGSLETDRILFSAE